MRKSGHTKVQFSEVMAALLDNSRPFPPTYLYELSDLGESDLVTLKRHWAEIPARRRVALLEDLANLQESNDVLSFERVAIHALRDTEAQTRIFALQILWDDPVPGRLGMLLNILQKDPEPTVRAQAAAVLGEYVFLGEMDELKEDQKAVLEEALLAAAEPGEDPRVRRRAVESLGSSSHPDVPGLIRAAFNSPEIEWVVSALAAMGRSADEERWGKTVFSCLQHAEPQIHIEAVRAAGNLGLSEARQPLLDMLEEGVDDQELLLTVIWALSGIGGPGVREALTKLSEEAEDDEEIDIIDEALENLMMSDSLESPEMFDFEIGLEDGDESEDTGERGH